MRQKKFLIYLPALNNYFMVSPWCFKSFLSKEDAEDFLKNSDGPILNNAEIKEIIVDDFSKRNLLGCGSIIGIIIVIILTAVLLCV